ncbi:MAG TPA: large conductance mechanosensitive channel protein MscL [Dissulfurispiraceae bacterium]|nr:large conductance mechanosensitive channel protein MscL [Dissulfurispiraceae bacterium]
MLKDFKEFVMRGNVLDMAVGIVIGAAFGVIVNSFVTDILTPPTGLMLGKVDFSNLFMVLKEGNMPAPYATLADAKKAGAVTLNIGVFVMAVINFLILAFSVFMVVKSVNAMKKQEAPAAPTTKDCPFCFTAIPIKATRCPNCTSELKG